MSNGQENMRDGCEVNPARTWVLVDITKWHGGEVKDHCDECMFNRPSFKCHLCIGRPEQFLLDDDIYYIRPQECKDMELGTEEYIPCPYCKSLSPNERETTWDPEKEMTVGRAECAECGKFFKFSRSSTFYKTEKLDG